MIVELGVTGERNRWRMTPLIGQARSSPVD
jgi:hypothetical protein